MRPAKAASLIVLLFSFSSAPILAGPLATHPLAYFDGFTTWAGTTAYDNGFGLKGTVDWTVFGPGDFDLAFPASGYSPPAGELVYAYQVIQDATATLEAIALSVARDDLQPVGTIGSFSGGGVSGLTTSFESFGIGSSDWLFTVPGVPAGGTSEGLSFSSTHKPVDLFGFVIDGGTVAISVPVPSPGPIAVPEPSTVILVGIGLALLGLGRLRRRRMAEM